MELYKDKLISITLPETPATKGHARVVSNTPLSGQKPSDTAQIISAASFISSMLFESLQAHGSNIIFSDIGNCFCDVLARREDDGLNFMWTPKQMQPSELDEVAAKIKDKCDFIGVEKTNNDISKTSSSVESSNTDINLEENNSSDKNKYWKKEKNYLLKQLDRLP